MKKDYYIFRESQTTTELEALFQLRYQSYINGKLYNFVKKNKFHLDIDAYDLHSHHFGLFKNNFKAIGYIRIVHAERFVNDKIVDLTCLHPWIKNIITLSRASPLPLFDYFPTGQHNKSFYNSIIMDEKKVVEVGRFSFSPETRSPSLVLHTAKAALTVGFICGNVNYAYLTCSPLHKVVYQKFGFRQASGTGTHSIHNIQRCCLIGSPGSLPPKLVPELQRMGEAYKQTGQISYCPDRPGCYFASVEKNITFNAGAHSGCSNSKSAGGI